MKFIPIPVRSNLARYVNGEIVSATDCRTLSQDMVEVDLPNGVLVHAGWYGTDIDGGNYRIYVQRGPDQLIPYLVTDDPYHAAYEVATLAAKYERYPLQISDSESNVTAAPHRLELVG